VHKQKFFDSFGVALAFVDGTDWKAADIGLL
jgi:hypothetical protein